MHLYLLKEINSRLQIHTKVNKIPPNAFPFVFLLFQNEHVVVIELLQLFVAEVDAELVKPVVLQIPVSRSKAHETH